MKIVLIGGGAGGLSTASNIRKLEKNAKITVITRDENMLSHPVPSYVPLVKSTILKTSSCTSRRHLERDIEVISRARYLKFPVGKKTSNTKNSPSFQNFSGESVELSTIIWL